MLKSWSDNYQVVLKTNFAGRIPVTVYKSQRTGLHVALAKAPGPSVSCQINLATEIDTDDGLPHTLEHLVFMGSKSFPFKGGLDLLSLNAMAVGGTNAYTAQDHTAYTVKTIGVHGMKQFVPIYCDHLLNPLLTPENYKTEVHHINEQGLDAGVVYSEMQEHENMLEMIVHRAKAKNIFPENPCLHVETGGRLKEIRDLCSVERVRAYHQQFYHLKNMWVMFCGSVEAEDVLPQLEKLDSLEENKPPAEFVRPFSLTKVPNIKLTRQQPITVKGPADDADEGVAEIGFLGRAGADMEFGSAMAVLFHYLSKTTSAPIEKEMILIRDPYCESVQMSISFYPRQEITVDFSGIPIDKLDSISDKFFEVVRKAAPANVIDMERIKYIIERKIKKIYAKLESNVANSVFNRVTMFQLYADKLDDATQFDQILNPVPTLELLLKKPSSYWSDLISEVFTDNCVVVLGRPDPAVAEELAKIESERVQKVAESMSEHKCQVKSTESEETKPPILDAIQTPAELPPYGTFDIKSTVLLAAPLRKKNAPATDAVWLPEAHKVGLDSLPFTSVVHAVDSKFMRALLLFDLKNVPLALRKYLLLFTDLLFSSPAIVDGQLLTDKQVADLFTKEIMDKSCSGGFLDQYLHFFHLYYELPREEIELLPKWTEIILKNTIFEKEKVLSIAKTLAGSASSTKRDGYSMCSAVLSSLNNVAEHESRFNDTFILEKFHRDLAKTLETQPAEAEQIINDLNALRDSILKAPMNAHFICDPKNVASRKEIPSNAWDFLDVSKKGIEPASKIGFDRETDVACYKQWTPASRVIKVDSTEASYVLQRVKADHDYGSPEHVALLIWCNYFSMMEGVLWKEVRGQGLAYSCGVFSSPDAQQLTLNLYRCSRPAQAYECSKQAIERVFREQIMEKSLFDSAKRGCVSSLISKYESLKSTATLTAFDNMRGLTREDIENLNRKVWEVDMETSFNLARPFFEDLFNEQKALRSIACHSSKLTEVNDAFPNTEVITAASLQYVPA